jgi:hypothetical protein
MKLNNFQSLGSLSKLKQRPWLMGLLLLTLMITLLTAINGEDDSSYAALPAKQPTKKAFSGSEKTAQALSVEKPEQLNQLHLNSSNGSTELLKTKLMSRNYATISRDIFQVQTWQPPQRKIQTPLPKVVPPAVAPPIPFVLIGSIENDNKHEYFFMQQNKLINLKMGETVNGQWRLDSEDARYLHWTYLPLNLPQILIKQNFQTNVDLSSNITPRP